MLCFAVISESKEADPLKRTSYVRAIAFGVIGALLVPAFVYGQILPLPSAPVAVGLRVPLAGFVAVDALDWARVEASAAIPGFSAPLVDFEGRGAVKLFPVGWERDVAGLPLRPFVGGGVVLLRAVDGWVLGWALLAGAEAPAPQWQLSLPLRLHAEGSLTLLPGASAPTVVLQLSLGASFSLANLLP